MSLDMEVGLGPGHIVLNGDPASPNRKGHISPPTFRPMFIVTTRSPISSTVLSTCSCSRAVAGCRSFFEPILVHGESKKGATIPLPVTLPNRSTYGKVTGKNMVALFMAALWNRAGHYIFVLWVSSIFYLFSSPILSRSRLDVYHTYTYGVVLVRI